MAHFEKYTASQLGQLYAHINRERDAGSYGNQQIDPARTNQNYCFKKSSAQEISQYIADNVTVKVRKDAVAIIGLCITLPREPKGLDSRLFFAKCYKFISQDFGNRVVSATVHMDETSPHMHVGIVPLVTKLRKPNGKKKKKGEPTEEVSLCAKELLTRSYLQKFHTRLDKYITEQLGVQTSVIIDERVRNGTLTKEERLNKKSVPMSLFKKIGQNAVDTIQEQISQIEFNAGIPFQITGKEPLWRKDELVVKKKDVDKANSMLREQEKLQVIPPYTKGVTHQLERFFGGNFEDYLKAVEDKKKLQEENEKLKQKIEQIQKQREQDQRKINELQEANDKMTLQLSGDFGKVALNTIPFGSIMPKSEQSMSNHSLGTTNPPEDPPLPKRSRGR